VLLKDHVVLADTLNGAIFGRVHLSEFAVSRVVLVVYLNKIAMLLLLEVLLEVLLPHFCSSTTCILGPSCASLAFEAALA
jgi:hypothetical protein